MTPPAPLLPHGIRMLPARRCGAHPAAGQSMHLYPSRESITWLAFWLTRSSNGSRNCGPDRGPGDDSDVGFTPSGLLPVRRGKEVTSLLLCFSQSSRPCLLWLLLTNLSLSLSLPPSAPVMQLCQAPSTSGPLHFLPGYLSHGQLPLPVQMSASMLVPSSPTCLIQTDPASLTHSSFISFLALT